jgi:hypothetical protein
MAIWLSNGAAATYFINDRRLEFRECIFDTSRVNNQG